MEQNKNKPSAAAQRAKNGSKIVHILPLEPDGSHPDQWGMIEDGVLTKNTKKAIDQTSFKAYKNGGKKRPHQEASAVESGKKKLRQRNLRPSGCRKEVRAPSQNVPSSLSLAARTRRHEHNATNSPSPIRPWRRAKRVLLFWPSSQRPLRHGVAVILPLMNLHLSTRLLMSFFLLSPNLPSPRSSNPSPPSLPSVSAVLGARDRPVPHARTALDFVTHAILFSGVG